LLEGHRAKLLVGNYIIAYPKIIKMLESGPVIG
jgi:hypothetical protein